MKLIRSGRHVAASLLTCGVLVSSVQADQHSDNEYSTAEELGLMQGFPPPPELRVDKTNGLFGVPQNRWSYQNMRTLFPTASVPNAVTPIDLP